MRNGIYDGNITATLYENEYERREHLRNLEDDEWEAMVSLGYKQCVACGEWVLELNVNGECENCTL